MLGRSRLIGLALPALVAALAVLPCRADVTGYRDVPGYEKDIRAFNLARGRIVFTDRCMRCHESGRKGAPVFGDLADWGERIEQPLETLIAHAIDGHGKMPARGDQDVSEQDVAAAVAYVVNRTRVIAAEHGLSTPVPNGEAAPDEDAADRAVVQMFLLLMRGERWN